MASDAPKHESHPVVAWVGVALLCGVAFAVAWQFVHYYSDDSQISLRYAQRLLQGKGLTWTDGEYVEGYSNLLWVLMTAGLGLFGMDLILATRVLGVASLFAVVALVCLDDDGRPAWPRVASGGAMVAVSGGLAVWAMGGLALTFLAMLGVAGLRLLRRVQTGGSWVAAAVLLALIAWTRVDGAVLAGALLIGAVIRGLPLGSAARVASGPGLAVLSQQVFRLWYYDDWVPNTARVKVSFTLERAWRGAEWVGDAGLAHIVLVLAALVALGVVRRRGLDSFVVAVIWSAYVAYVGGDIFRGWRLFLPAIPMLAMGVADASERVRFKPAWLGLLAVAALHGWWNLDRPDEYRIPDRPLWTFRTKAVADALREHFAGSDPLLAVDAAGALPYFTEFDAVDMLGLTDRYLPRHPPEHWGKNGVGHDLGDGAYILRRKPDIVAFRSGLGGEPRFVSGRQMARTQAFKTGYRKAVVASDLGDEAVRGIFYFRIIDGPAAPDRDAQRVVVPGHLLGTGRFPSVPRDGSLGPLLREGEKMTVQFPVGVGRWRVEVEGTGDVARPGEVKADERGVVRFPVRARSPEAHIRRIRFVRADRAFGQFGETADGVRLGQRWNRARTTEDERIEELEALGYLSGTEAPSESIGVTHFTTAASPGLNLYVSGHDATIRLIDMAGQDVHVWAKPWSEAFPERAREGRSGPRFFRRAFLVPDGSGDVLGIYDGNGLVRLNRDSEVVWAWWSRAHHDLAFLDDGRMWVLDRRAKRIPSVDEDEPVLEDFAVLLSPDGEELKRVSLLAAFRASPATRQMFENREHDFADLLHTNSLEVLDGRVEVPGFEAGNLLLSSRSLSALFTLDPDTGRIPWAVQGDFRFQHDPKILDSGHLLVFDNMGPGSLRSAVREYEPRTMEQVWSYVGTEAAPFFSRYCGTAQRLENGNTLVVESGVGRVFEITPAGERVWVFDSPHRTGPDDAYVAIVPDLVRIPIDPDDRSSRPPEIADWIDLDSVVLTPW
jgi:hypothetical protein